KIKRSQFAAFLNTTPAGTTPTWSLIGDGVTEMSISYNPQTSEAVFINQNSGTTDIESYKPTIETPMTALAGDEVFEFVDSIRVKRKILSDCVTECLLVYLYKDAVSNAYPAEKNTCAVQIDEFGGAGGESTKLSFTLNLQGDGVQGTFNPTTKAFTATV
ncbi:MAG: hypothetical protein RR825_04515, partial [Ruthenibacterium sp.]